MRHVESLMEAPSRAGFWPVVVYCSSYARGPGFSAPGGKN